PQGNAELLPGQRRRREEQEEQLARLGVAEVGGGDERVAAMHGGRAERTDAQRGLLRAGLRVRLGRPGWAGLGRGWRGRGWRGGCRRGGGAGQQVVERGQQAPLPGGLERVV